MSERATAAPAKYGDPVGQRAPERPTAGARYTLAAARDAGYRALGRLDDEMALGAVRAREPLGAAPAAPRRPR